jgi:site-specific recombinase XerD
MASITVYFKDSQQLKDGQYSIYLLIIKDRKKKYIKIGTSSKEHWDIEKNLPAKKHPEYKELLIKIKQKESEANKLLLTWETDNVDFSADQVKQSLDSSKRKKVSVFTYFKNQIAKFKSANRLGYADVFNSTLKNLEKYRDGKDIDFLDVNKAFITDFVDFLKGQPKPLSDNAVFVYLRTFKTLLNYARADGAVKETYNPFKEVSFKKYRSIKTKKRAITGDKVKEIIKLKLEPETRLWHSKNYFLFSYYTMGTNFSDMASLTWDSLANDTLTYIRTKTKKEYNIPLNDKAKRILDVYRKVRKDNYIFPILSEDRHITPTQKRDRIKTELVHLNSDLRDIAAKAGITEKLTSYVARHTAATTLKRSGETVATIKELMGHDSERTTEIYLDQLDNSVLKKAMNRL